jgi:hypothetical protein
MNYVDKCKLCSGSIFVTNNIYYCDNTSIVNHATWESDEDYPHQYQAFSICNNALWIYKKERPRIIFNWSNGFDSREIIDIKFNIKTPQNIEQLKKIFDTARLLK